MSEADAKPRKGLGPIAWVLIGCGSLTAIAAAAAILLGFFVANKAREVAADFEANPAMSAAELIVRLNPELELVSKDEEARTLTVRNTATGEVVTVDVNAIKDGRISFETAEGTSSIRIDPEGGRATISGPDGSTTFGGADALPDWVPRYPGANVGQLQQSDIPQGLITLASLASDDPAEKVLEFYRGHFEARGYDVRRVDVDGGPSTVFVTAADKTRKLNVSMADVPGGGSAGMLRVNVAREP